MQELIEVHLQELPEDIKQSYLDQERGMIETVYFSALDETNFNDLVGDKECEEMATKHFNEAYT